MSQKNSVFDRLMYIILVSNSRQAKFSSELDVDKI